MGEIRNVNDVIDLIKSHFSFLFDQGYKVISSRYDNYDNWKVILHSNKSIIQIVRDRGELAVDIGPPWESDYLEGYFFELHLLIEYLNGKKLTVLLPSQPKNLDDQFRNLAILLFNNIDNINSFLNSEDFLQKAKEIRRLRMQILKEMFPNMIVQEEHDKIDQ